MINSVSVNLIPVENTLTIRQQILRPKLLVNDCYFAGDNDESTHHFGAFINNSLVGVVSLFNQNTNKLTLTHGQQIRAMATIQNVRGQGVGYKLLSVLESHAFDNGAAYLWANARVSAKGFYEKAGYTIDNNEFMIEGVGNHVLVSKQANKQ